MSGFRKREAARNNLRNALTEQSIDRAGRLQTANAELVTEVNELRGRVADLTAENRDLQATVEAYRTKYAAVAAEPVSLEDILDING